MIDPANVPIVTSEEVLARFVLFSRHVRASDSTIRPEAYMPHPHADLSVTRHLSATELELWAVGRSIAESQGKTLHGRADCQARDCENEALRVQADPVDANPNHAVVLGWPAEKSAQKLIAQRIAAAATFIPCG